MDGNLTFNHHGKEYAASVVSSTGEVPHFHWVFFKDELLERQVGEDVAFVVMNGELKPVNRILARKNKELFDQVQHALEKHLKSGETLPT